MTVYIKNIENYTTNATCAVLDIKDSTERRKFTRIPFIKDVIIDGSIHSTTLDISEEGLYISLLLPLLRDSVVEITIPENKGYIRVNAQVQFCEPGIGMWLQFIDVRYDERLKIRKLIAGLKGH